MPVITAQSVPTTQSIQPQQLPLPIINETPPQTQEKAQETQTEAPKNNEFSQKFAALAQREKLLRQHARKLESEKQALKQRESEIEQSTYSKWKQKLAQNPWDTMLEAGLTPEQATQIMLNQPKPEDIQFQKLQQEIESLKNSQNQSLEQMKKAQDEQYKQARRQIGSEVKILIDSDPSYEMIQSMKAQEAVVELIEQTFHQQGYLMPIDEAAKEVEEYLFEQALNLSKLKKVQSKLTPQPEPVKQTQSIEKQTPQTLSNRMVVQTTKPLSDKERRQRAILAFQGKL